MGKLLCRVCADEVFYALLGKRLQTKSDMARWIGFDVYPWFSLICKIILQFEKIEQDACTHRLAVLEGLARTTIGNGWRAGVPGGRVWWVHGWVSLGGCACIGATVNEFLGYCKFFTRHHLCLLYLCVRITR